jgi:hypothetical protein
MEMSCIFFSNEIFLALIRAKEINCLFSAISSLPLSGQRVNVVRVVPNTFEHF